MALSDERIAELKEVALKIAPLHRSAARPFARSIEAEVRKEYEARIAELEAQLEAVGAGGVGALIPNAEPKGAIALYEAPPPQQISEPASADEPGWLCEHRLYGTWFISRAAVIADWKNDQKHAYPEKPEAEPGNEAVDTWLNEQTSWAEIGVNGKQLARPDMSGHEAAWREEMTRNTDLPEMRAATPKEPS